MTAEKSIYKENSSNLFAFRTHNQYVNFFDLYLLNFKSIPNSIFEENIDCKKANEYLIENYKGQIIDKFYRKSRQSNSRNLEITEAYFILDNILIALFLEENKTYFLFTDNVAEEIQSIINQLSRFKKRDKINATEIFLLVNSAFGIETSPLKISKPKLKIKDNYNEDFSKTHQIISNRLSRKNDKGLVLLHGKPGTGKTSYIRYLITTLKKKVIFLPPNMAVAITNPDFLSILIENPNSIFVIEDAENIILDRDQNGSSAVSTLLNLSDGLLSDCLNIQIVCSFNTDISKIDAALMRKGRLIAKYEFKELEIEKAQQLSDKLGFKTKFNQPTLLTDIYNQLENDFKEDKKKIGF